MNKEAPKQTMHSYKPNIFSCQAIFVTQYVLGRLYTGQPDLTVQYNEQYIQYRTMDSIYRTVQWTVYSVQYNGQYIQYSTMDSIYSKVQWTVYTVQYNEQYIQYSTMNSINSTVQWTVYTVQ